MDIRKGVEDVGEVVFADEVFAKVSTLKPSTRAFLTIGSQSKGVLVAYKDIDNLILALKWAQANWET